ncbi:DNA-binding beta-propeller fold protein YncE [Nocardia sp. GAS34]|uniref:YncE family protein n=1 Tax=unclassified Nocardia TaxID=2637762 RepID=UPI003D228197
MQSVEEVAGAHTHDRAGRRVLAATVAGCSTSLAPPDTGALPVRQVGEVVLPGAPVRFDYTVLDAGRGLLFAAHMGAGELVEVDVHAHAVVRTVGDLPDVHGVIVVPPKGRMYASVTGRNQLVALDEITGAVLYTAPTDTYPDGLAYDPIRNTVWTTNEHAGTETVIDADTGAVRATVRLGGEVGNVVYDRSADTMVVAVQGENDLAVIDPADFAVTERIPMPGCDHPHGQALDAVENVMFVGCEANASVLTVDLIHHTAGDLGKVGETPDVLVYDQSAHRVYVATESGWVSVFDRRAGHTVAAGSRHLADGAHTLALDPLTHHSYFPIPKGSTGGPVLREFEPTS